VDSTAFTYCGASLVREHVALTAAHCLPLYTGDQVVAGASIRYDLNGTDGTAYDTALDAVCPKYLNTGGLYGDVGLVFLNRCIQPGPTVRVIKMATKQEWSGARSSSPLLISGFGTTSADANEEGQDGAGPEVLQYGNARYIGAGTCNGYLRKRDWSMLPKYEFW